MLKRASILPYISFGLIVLFLLGTTPRQFVHDLCQDHQHAVTFPDSEHETQFSEADYHCGYNTPVATVSYLPAPYIHFQVLKTLPAVYNLPQVVAIEDQEKLRALLRGPPAIV